ncbi:MAG: N-6 DNA methylase, partial [Methylobacteriaceae bacterium]|nr:N-6 DNA methylase [Methylobacteriaceae bacterium]
MPLSWIEIQDNAVRFAKRWENARREEADAQTFQREFFALFGITDILDGGVFEYKVPLDDGRTGYIDYFRPRQIAVEMKSKDKDLDAAYRQAINYVAHLSADVMPELVMVCDFHNIHLYHRTSGVVHRFKTGDLSRHVKKFAVVAGYETTRDYDDQAEVNVKAAEKMARLHDALKEHGYEGHDLEVYLVRLLFMMFADDTGIFPKDGIINYVDNSRPDGADLSDRLNRLFDVLNMPPEVREKRSLLAADLKQFPYVNGGLFADRLPPADFNARMRATLIDCCSFDWHAISPAVFGAMFQGVMDAEKRRELGAHYTSEENILKLIRPLFLDGLRREFEAAKTSPLKLDALHDKISRLKFLDPACGCGNFLIITYRELRRLEHDILKLKIDNNQRILDVSALLKVNVSQFYGIEIEDFPCQIAQVGLWLADHQMNLEIGALYGQVVTRLPLTRSPTIVRANALTTDWASVVPERELSYILGNPPFSGARFMGAAQKADMAAVFGPLKNVGNLDYVTAWYWKAAGMMQGTDIRAAFVSTNSITQGEQVAILWRPLSERFNIRITFAWRTFKWSNEARGKAAVHCAIIGFSQSAADGAKALFDENGERRAAANINAYLMDGPDMFLDSRSRPICPVPEIGIGNKPIDDGNYLFTEAEKDEFLRVEPAAAQWFRPWLGADEFINGYRRYCLWLGGCTPAELRAMPHVMKRIEAVRQFRLNSKSAGTRKIAATPTRFHVENMPKGNYIVIPEVSSERRQYIPIGFLTPDVLCSNKLRLMPDATLYHFGILTSNVHNGWMRAVCGRLETRYSYSIDIVYNNFPWPDASGAQQQAIAATARGVLDARAGFPDSTLADLYDPVVMPPVLRKAHDALDKLVRAAYGFPADLPEPDIVSRLMTL